jgi:hypothetical protein
MILVVWSIGVRLSRRHVVITEGELREGTRDARVIACSTRTAAIRSSLERVGGGLRLYAASVPVPPNLSASLGRRAKVRAHTQDLL